jgi:hypothetical protein
MNLDTNFLGELSSETTFVYDPDDSTGHTESVESESDGEFTRLHACASKVTLM